jgi:hypothetical protein
MRKLQVRPRLVVLPFIVLKQATDARSQGVLVIFHDVESARVSASGVFTRTALLRSGKGPRNGEARSL